MSSLKYDVYQLHEPDINRLKEAIRDGVDVNSFNSYKNKKSPLASAISNSNEAGFMYLIHSGADINKKVIQDISGYTPLWYSVILQKYTFTDILLRYGAKQTFYDRWSLLTYSIKHRQLELLKCLLKYDVDVNEADEHGNIPLELLAVRLNYISNIDMVRLLLDHGAEFTIQTAFMSAIRCGNLEVVQLFLERGADVNFESITGYTPFTKATSLGRVEIAEEMLKKGVDDVDKLNPDGHTPLIDCIKELLVKHGAKVQLANSHGNILLAECLNAKYFPAMKLLVDAGAKWANLRDQDGNSPLTLAVQMRNFSMLRYFLDKKANVNELDNNHKTPLVVAVETNNIRFIKLLIECGADISGVFDKIEGMAKTNDNWKKLIEEVLAERRILE